MTRLSRARIVSVVALVAIVAVAAGMFLLGPPGDERIRRLDARRVDDLEGIAGAVDLFWTRHGRLPASVAELQREPGIRVDAADPVTTTPYDYRPVGALAFELCAEFERDSEGASTVGGTFWSHGAGRQCFPRDARKVR